MNDSTTSSNRERQGIESWELSDAGLQNADQRITEDVEKFAFTISELYSYTFKVSSNAQPGLM